MKKVCPLIISKYLHVRNDFLPAKKIIVQPMTGKMTTVNNKGGQISEGILNIVPSSSKGMKLLFANLYNIYRIVTSSNARY